ncbi:YbaK/EbsC family protein [Yinghuangia soli]|uniref:YbaK/EbsC family protein n=1 Tax=Yinghuangia soli TaxID=2908204 RepID=A0AA41PVS0_9ACTN|nr:YbaK/EbsC family protein [Yinghuangia soli]MCF2526774.1 YbaK/EbsC family protein [Yinghuangia soli]
MGESLDLQPALTRLDLLAAPVAEALKEWSGSVPVEQIEAAEIDPDLADTAAFCAHYGVTLEESVNCVVVAAKRGAEVTYAACMVAATTRADVNGLVRKHLGARKASFAPLAEVAEASGMEYGGITPIGLPAGWPILVDAAAAALPSIIIGSGNRRSKLRLPGRALAELPGAEVLDGLGVPLG